MPGGSRQCQNRPGTRPRSPPATGSLCPRAGVGTAPPRRAPAGMVVDGTGLLVCPPSTPQCPRHSAHPNFQYSHHSQYLPQYPGTPSMPGKSCIFGTPSTPSPLAPPAPLALPAALLLSQYPQNPSTPDAPGNSGIPSAPLHTPGCPKVPGTPVLPELMVSLRPPAPLGPPTLPVPWVFQLPLSPFPR